MTTRARIPEVGEAIRLAVERAIAADLSPTDWRVFACTLSLVASWTRLADSVYRRQVADCAGMSERTVTRSLERLHAFGVVVWRPASGRGRRSYLGLPTVNRDTPDANPRHAEAETETRMRVSLPRRQQTEEKPTRGESTDAEPPLTRHPGASAEAVEECVQAVAEAVIYLTDLGCADARTATTLHRETFRLGLTAAEVLWSLDRLENRHERGLVADPCAYLVGILQSVAAGYSGPETVTDALTPFPWKDA